MPKPGSSPTRSELIDRIRAAERDIGKGYLSFPDFRIRTGWTMSPVYKHFDSWSSACRAAGVRSGPTKENLVHRERVSDDFCVAELKRVAELLGRRDLSIPEFTRHGRVSATTVRSRLGGWRRALERAGLEPCELTRKSALLTEEQCVEELKRVARILGHAEVSCREYKQLGKYSYTRICRAMGGWLLALQKAGLHPASGYKRKLPLPELADSFLRVVIETGRVPTIWQMTRRTGLSTSTLGARRFGGYRDFKRRAIEQLVQSKRTMPKYIRRLLDEELASLLAAVPARAEDRSSSTPHRQGRTLHFRQFIYAPTGEPDVVSLFGAVAEELGFEIVGNRSPFPDCEARRKVPGRREHFVRCMIEYEYSSSDYRRHRHPATGCDLVVCWKHDWPKCPVEVLELSQAITKLPGWKGPLAPSRSDEAQRLLEE